MQKISEEQLAGWLELPQTKLYLQCLNDEAAKGRQSLYDGRIDGGNAEEVGILYLSVINRCEAIEMISEADQVLRGYDLIIPEEGEENVL